MRLCKVSAVLQPCYILLSITLLISRRMINSCSAHRKISLAPANRISASDAIAHVYNCRLQTNATLSLHLIWPLENLTKQKRVQATSPSSNSLLTHPCCRAFCPQVESTHPQKMLLSVPSTLNVGRVTRCARPRSARRRMAPAASSRPCMRPGVVCRYTSATGRQGEGGEEEKTLR